MRSNREPRDMNSITMHMRGGLVQAAMKRTTLGWRRAVITSTSSLNARCISLERTPSAAISLTATSVPFHVACSTTINQTVSQRVVRQREKGVSYAIDFAVATTPENVAHL
jgi:hypothetical protein